MYGSSLFVLFIVCVGVFKTILNHAGISGHSCLRHTRVQWKYFGKQKSRAQHLNVTYDRQKCVLGNVWLTMACMWGKCYFMAENNTYTCADI